MKWPALALFIVGLLFCVDAFIPKAEAEALKERDKPWVGCYVEHSALKGRDNLGIPCCRFTQGVALGLKFGRD